LRTKKEWFGGKEGNGETLFSNRTHQGVWAKDGKLRKPGRGGCMKGFEG